MSALYLCMEEDNAGTQGIATWCSLLLAGEMLNLALFSLQPLGYAIPPQNLSLLPKLLEPEPQVFSRDGSQSSMEETNPLLYQGTPARSSCICASS